MDRLEYENTFFRLTEKEKLTVRKLKSAFTNKELSSGLNGFVRKILRLRIVIIVMFRYVVLSIVSPTFRDPNFLVENILRPASIISIISIVC